MRDGRVILVAEKRAPGFYQLAGRRINLDGGDYHPLFGQRSSVGFNQYTDVVELADKNFAAIFSDRGAAHGAGTLAILNRSVGIDQASDDPEDYLVDPEALARINPEFFQHSITIPDRAATGKPETAGAYRNPSPLPNGHLLVSYASNVVNLESFSGNFDVYDFDPISGTKSPLVAGADDELWPVAVYKRTPGTVFVSKLEEPNGSSRIYTDDERKSRARHVPGRGAAHEPALPEHAHGPPGAGEDAAALHLGEPPARARRHELRRRVLDERRVRRALRSAPAPRQRPSGVGRFGGGLPSRRRAGPPADQREARRRLRGDDPLPA